MFLIDERGNNMVTKLHQSVTALGFKATRACYAGAGMYRELPKVKHATVRKLFGTSFAHDRREKYSDLHLIEFQGVVVTLYMSFGVWRFGAIHERVTPELEDQLQKLQTLLEA
jgi:hypothetical protein